MRALATGLSAVALVMALAFHPMRPAVATAQSTTTVSITAVSFAAAPTWNTGDTWTFRLYDGRTDTLQVVDVTEGTYTVLEHVSDGTVNTLHFSRTLATNDNSIITAKSLLRPQWPLDQKRTWPFAFPDVDISGKTTTFQMTYATPGTTTKVTVPAGTFEAVKIHVRECNVSANVCGDADVWYAPAAKWFVKISFSNSNFWGATRSGKSDVLTSAPHQG